MKLKILKPSTIVAEAEVDAVTLPGLAGQLTPMSGHDLLITPLKAGVVYFKPLVNGVVGDKQEYKIGDGFAEILKDRVTVFTESAEAIVKNMEAV